MITVSWSSSNATYAEVWRVLDLSGMTNSVRKSRNYTKAGFAYLNGARVGGLKTKVEIGSVFTLELRFPNGRIFSEEIFLTTRPPRNTARQTGPSVRNYKG